MTNVQSKFVASAVVINEDIDMDVELVRAMLADEKGRLEIYDTAATTSGEIYIVDADLALAEGIAGMLNEAYVEFLDAESAAAHSVAASAREAVNTAFEGESRVPVAGSAEDAAIANMEKKSVSKNQTKNEKVETKMTNTNSNQSQEQINAQSAAARAFLNKQASKLEQANNGPVKSEKKEEIAVKDVKKPSVKKDSKPSVSNNQTKTEKEVVNVKRQGTVKLGANAGQGRQSAGANSSRQSAGATVKLNVKKVQTNNRVQFDESMNTFNKFEGPWYLNAGLHSAVERIEDLVATRQDEATGIKDIRFVDPSTVLRYDNHDIISIVEIVTEGKKGDNTWSFRIQTEDREEKTADLKSTNIGWDTVGGELRPVYQYFKKNEENMVTFSTKSGRKTVALNAGVTVEEENATYYTKVDDKGDVHGFVFNYEKEEITALDEKKYSIPNYVPVVKEEVSAEVIVLALAFAQYAHGLNMHGLVEDAE